jgi:hypothetical protein
VTRREAWQQAAAAGCTAARPRPTPTCRRHTAAGSGQRAEGWPRPQASTASGTALTRAMLNLMLNLRRWLRKAARARALSHAATRARTATGARSDKPASGRRLGASGHVPHNANPTSGGCLAFSPVGPSVVSDPTSARRRRVARAGQRHAAAQSGGRRGLRQLARPPRDAAADSAAERAADGRLTGG